MSDPEHINLIKQSLKIEESNTKDSTYLTTWLLAIQYAKVGFRAKPPILHVKAKLETSEMNHTNTRQRPENPYTLSKTQQAYREQFKRNCSLCNCSIKLLLHLSTMNQKNRIKIMDLKKKFTVTCYVNPSSNVQLLLVYLLERIQHLSTNVSTVTHEPQSKHERIGS